MGYDPRYDAFGALALGGIGALGGLGYSLLGRKRRKLKNALIGAAALPALYIGGKYIGSQFIPEKNMWALNEFDPIYKHISEKANDYIYNKMDHSAIDEHRAAITNTPAYDPDRDYDSFDWDSMTDKTDSSKTDSSGVASSTFGSTVNAGQNNADLAAKANQQGEHILNNIATIGYGTLGLGIGLPALYLNYLNKKKKKNPWEEEDEDWA